MTTNRRTNCQICNVKFTAKNFDPREHTDLCIVCFDQAGWENDHYDGNHEEGAEMTRCPLCNPAIVGIAPDKVKLSRTGHTNTAPHSRSSHKNCYAINAHPATPAGRAACRRTRTN